MKQIDLSNMSLNELKQLNTAVEKAIDAGAAQQLSDARAQIAEIAKNVGMSLKDLITMKAVLTKNSVAIKYRDPTNPKNEWTGRGRAPHWVAAMREAGTLDKALV
ncbi:H-NS histone family protein [Massilia sp. CCM 9210]|uniref:H-NS histone family protein n=1 Tax=Massilia scottii TaxID=3057166 RepID=UPI0027968E2B|nr:H-NS histone family protein [Massilia sp. CCM 9210]MDQ1817763.1 H-NS histone family protein [Massilia sp. CCM 9210]